MSPPLLSGSQALVRLLPAILAPASLAVVLADARPAALLALASFAVVLSDARPAAFGKPAMLTYKEGSYVNDLFHALQEHLSAEQLSGCLAMQGPKHLRDFMVVWYDQLLLTL